LLNYRLVDHFLKLSRVDQAVNYLKGILQYFPDEEQACILLMTLYHEQGDLKALTYCYKTYVGYLEEELNVEPSLKLQDTYQSLIKWKGL